MGITCFAIQAGNPKNGIQTVGQYCIVNNGNGTFTANYTMNPTITIGGFVYDIVVLNSHLSISQNDTNNVHGKPWHGRQRGLRRAVP